MTEQFEKESGNEALWRTIFQEGHPELKKQQWLHQKMPQKPRCRMCYSPFKGIGGWIQRTFRHREPSSRNPHYCSACDSFINQFSGGAEVDLSILFIDIRESTQFAALATPAEVNHRVNRFLDTSTQIITDHDGFIMAFYGDCVVAVWPPGFSGPDHAQKAMRASKALTKHFSLESASERIPVGIGCHTGRVYIGTVNAAKGLFRDVSIFGQDVILTARLAAKAEANQALISDSCWQAANGQEPDTNAQDMTLKGFNETVKAHKIQPELE